MTGAAAPPPLYDPALDRHRLLGGAGLAVLIDDDAVVDWWCQPGLDDAPQLWRLLDPHGGTARWWNATGVRRVGAPAGPCARTSVNIDGEVLSCWDGLVRLGGRPALVRLIRSTTTTIGVTHELRAGGFGPDGGTAVSVASTGDAPHHVDGSTFCSIDARPDRWAALVIGSPEVVVAPIHVCELLSAMAAAERRASRLVDAGAVVHAHRDRVEAALLVLDACTDPATGAVAAAPTTSVSEVPGADRQSDDQRPDDGFAGLRDASLAATVAATMGRADVTNDHLDWLMQRCLACDQVHIDGAGLAADAVWALVRAGGGLRRDAFHAMAAVADEVCRHPREPSGGIWERRGAMDGTSADIGRWLLFDRAVRLSWLHEPWGRSRRARWRLAGAGARKRVLASRLPSGAIPLEYGGTEADGAGLLPVALGLLHRRSPEADALVDGTLADLGVGEPVRSVARYPETVDDGVEGDSGAYVPVSWLAVSALAQVGRPREARDLADRLCRSLPGLQPEVLDGDQAPGNLPLAWSHAEAARALYLLRLAEVRARFGRVGTLAWEAARAVRARRARRALSTAV